MFKSEYDMREAGTWDESAQTVTETICPYCGVGCAVELHAQDDRIVKVTSPTRLVGDRRPPVHQGPLRLRVRQQPTAPVAAIVVDVSWAQALAWRMRRHELDPIGRLALPELVRRLSGVQAQVASSAELAVRVRSTSIKAGDVGRAWPRATSSRPGRCAGRSTC